MAVLGANDGIVSTASLIIGMAAGEYVSVSSQADTEKADLALEKDALENNPDQEKEELAKIYEERGLEPELASQVAVQLMKHDALGTHARDEIGISEISNANPLQAAFSSTVTFWGALAMGLTAVVGQIFGASV